MERQYPPDVWWNLDHGRRGPAVVAAQSVILSIALKVPISAAPAARARPPLWPPSSPQPQCRAATAVLRGRCQHSSSLHCMAGMGGGGGCREGGDSLTFLP